MKVLLEAINSKYIHSNLAVRYLKSFTKDMDYTCVIREDTINDLKENILEGIMQEKPDAVGFSCYIWNITIVKQLAKTIKLIAPHIQIFVGGPEVSFQSDKIILDNDFDYIIDGEGEQTYKEFIEARLKCESNFLNDRDLQLFKNIKGLFTKYNNKVYSSGKRDIMDINRTIFPYSENDNLTNKIVYYEASRGCPFGCKYCLSSVDKKVRFLNIERVKKEIKFLIDKKVKMVKFVDRTFNCNPKYAKEIWQYIVDQDPNVKTTFHFEVCADLLNNEEIEILKKSLVGRIQLEVGIQTTNDDILKNINRHINFSSISEKIKEVEKLKNIKQHVDLIAGLPGECYESFKKSFNDVYTLKPEEIQLGFLKILSGSPMKDEVNKYGIIYNPYPPYNVLKTNDISYEEICILNKIEKLVDKYYNSRKFQNILAFFEFRYDNIFDFFYDLSMYFLEKGNYVNNLSFSDTYEVFINFNNEKLNNKDEELLKDVIRFDYLIYSKKKYIPEFLNSNIDKKMRKRIFENLKEKLNYNNMQIAKFKFDILKYIDTKKIIKQDSIIAFNCEKENQYFDITKYVRTF